MKPIHDNLKAVRIEDDETGDLLPLLDYAGQKFSNLVKAVVDTNKGGTITLKVTVRPSTAGALAVKPEVRVTLPKGAPAEALLWPTPDGNLVAEDPGKTSLNCGRFKTRRANSKPPLRKDFTTWKTKLRHKPSSPRINPVHCRPRRLQGVVSGKHACPTDSQARHRFCHRRRRVHHLHEPPL
ncbi:hypothetical protein [Accumulibacter sp.]|uniref:hypothetical protein n=1 Tax=Accumulibacter sp. TaxID=2053492 RepID=UPI002590B47B|nr:hypothetical protein [Accumulibacter sp.]